MSNKYFKNKHVVWCVTISVLEFNEMICNICNKLILDD